jgi:formate dehydrogenase subunit gamma
MAAATTPPAEAGVAGPVARFEGSERLVHWTTAALVAGCLATAAALYLPGLATIVGRRTLVKEVHVLSGLALPLPILVGVLGPWAASLRRDLRRLNRFDAHDRRWLRSLGRDPLVRQGKFNGGQKLNAAFTGGALLLLLASGSVMRWFGPFPLTWRTGATFVHDWIAAILVVVLIGHVAKAVGDREALLAMATGRPVSRRWASRKAPRWLEALDHASDGAPSEVLPAPGLEGGEVAGQHPGGGDRVEVVADDQ